MAISIAPGETKLSVIVSVIRKIIQGRLSVTGSFTLAASAASTTVLAPNCGVGCAISYTPQTAHASAEVGNGTIYIAAADVSSGQFIVHHANNSQTDRTFSYVCLG